MNCLPKILISAVILIAGTAGASVTSQAQTDASASRSCDASNVSGRPTLKRRLLSATGEMANEVRATEQVVQKGICLSDKNESNEANNQKPLLITFQGLHAVSEADVLKLFREQGAAIAGDRMPDSKEVDKLQIALKEILQAHGYVQATVEILKDETSRSLSFFVNEGTRFPISEIKFEGNKIFSSSELRAKLRENLAKYEASENEYEAEKFEVSLRRLTDFLRSQGYLQAKLAEQKKEISERGLLVTISVEEGPLYRLGEIEIEGATVLPPGQIRAMLSLQRGDIVSGEAIAKWLFEDLKKVYGEMGYIQFAADPEPKFKIAINGGNEGVVNLRVTVDEGPQFKVGSIIFQGTNLPEKELRDMLTIREGDVFDQKLFEDTVKRINETGWFEIIDKDKDADFRTNEEEALVSIVIKISKRPNPDQNREW